MKRKEKLYLKSAERNHIRVYPFRSKTECLWAVSQEPKTLDCRYVRNLLRAVLTLFGLPPALLPALPHPPKKVPLDFLELPHPQEAILCF